MIAPRKSQACLNFRTSVVIGSDWEVAVILSTQMLAIYQVNHSAHVSRARHQCLIPRWAEVYPCIM